FRLPGCMGYNTQQVVASGRDRETLVCRASRSGSVLSSRSVHRASHAGFSTGSFVRGASDNFSCSLKHLVPRSDSSLMFAVTVAPLSFLLFIPLSHRPVCCGVCGGGTITPWAKIMDSDSSSLAGRPRLRGGGDSSLLSFFLGPVQPFIASARSVRDLWSGSFLLRAPKTTPPNG